MTNLFRWLAAAETEAATQATEAAAQASSGDPISSMANLMDYAMILILFGVAIYVIYTIIKLKKECVLIESKILYPGDCHPQDCLDPAGFIDYMFPRLVIFALVLLLCGGFTLFLQLKPELETGLTATIELVVPVLALVWYVLVSKKAAKRFWYGEEKKDNK